MQGLLERDRELALLDDACRAAASGTGGTFVVAGPPGIGKTRLMQACATLARGHGLTVLRARGGELEQAFPFGVARQLFEAELATAPDDRRDALLAGAAGAGGVVLGVLPPPAEPVGDQTFASVHGLYWVAANLAAEAPLALLVDDAHWSDDPSAQWLAYLAARADELPIMLVIATRDGEPGASPALPVIERASRAVLRPGALSREGVRSLVRTATGTDDEALADRCLSLTRGNPFFVATLLHDAASVREGIAGDGTRQLERAILGRLGRLAPDAVALARAVAVLGTDADLRHAAALAGLDVEAAGRAADALARADILQDGRPLEFVHPVVRTTVAEALPAGERSAAHRRAADVLAAEGVPAATVGLHLLAVDPAGDPAVVDRLRAAAAAAMGVGAPELARRFLERALAEPPASRDERALTLLELGSAERQTFDPGAVPHLRAAMELLEAPALRAHAAVELAMLLVPQGAAAEAEALLREQADRREALAAEQAGLLCALHTVSIRFAALPSQDVLDRDRAVLEQLPAETLSAKLLLAAMATESFLRNRPAGEAVDLARRALDTDGELLADRPDLSLLYNATVAAMFAEADDLADAAYDHAIEVAGVRGSRYGASYVCCWRAWLRLLQGRLRDAELDAAMALEDRAYAQLRIGVASAGAAAVGALTAQGRLEDADVLLAQHALQGDVGPSVFELLLVTARGELRLAQGDLARALEDARDAERRVRVADLMDCGSLRWRHVAARALLAAGEPGEAAAVSTEQLRLAHEYGAPGVLGLAEALHGVVLGGEEGLTLLESGCRRLAGAPRPLDAAWARVELGAALRRAGARLRAREELGTAAQEAERIGATPLAERAYDELRAAGGRRRRRDEDPDQLTPAERRVVDLALAGRTNKQIAQSLFLTLRTVETHLTRTYRKLGIGSRAELAAAVAASDSWSDHDAIVVTPT